MNTSTMSGSDRMLKTKRSERGFTLVEAIIAAIAAFATMSLTAEMPSYRADQAMAQITSQLRAARQRALSQRHSVQVSFSGTNTMTFTDILLKGVAQPPANVQFEGGGVYGTVAGVPDTPMLFGNASGIVFGGI